MTPETLIVQEFHGKDRLDIMLELLRTREALRELHIALNSYLSNGGCLDSARAKAYSLLRNIDAEHQTLRGEAPRS